nr:hypothetical protein [Gammaproteobacteria bacterium]
MLNLEKLKALAEAARTDNAMYGDPNDWQPSFGLSPAEQAFAEAVSPAAVLGLIAELERLREKVRGVETARTSRNAEMDGKVLNYLRDRTGSTAWAMAGAIGASREEVSKACQRLRRKGLIETSATRLAYWQAVKA